MASCYSKINLVKNFFLHFKTSCLSACWLLISVVALESLSVKLLWPVEGPVTPLVMSKKKYTFQITSGSFLDHAHIYHISQYDLSQVNTCSESVESASDQQTFWHAIVGAVTVCNSFVITCVLSCRKTEGVTWWRAFGVDVLSAGFASPECQIKVQLMAFRAYPAHSANTSGPKDFSTRPNKYNSGMTQDQVQSFNFNIIQND